MKLYTATVRLGDSIGESANEVVRHNLTAAEMKVLEHIHAGKKAALIDIAFTGTVNRKDRKERARLNLEYCEGSLGKWGGLVEKLFGVEGVSLPQEYEAPIAQAIEALDDDDEEEVFEMIDSSERSPTRSMTAADIVG